MQNLSNTVLLYGLLTLIVLVIVLILMCAINYKALMSIKDHRDESNEKFAGLEHLIDVLTTSASNLDISQKHTLDKLSVLEDRQITMKSSIDNVSDSIAKGRNSFDSANDKIVKSIEALRKNISKSNTNSRKFRNS